MIYCSTCKHFAICYKAKQAIDLEKPLQFKTCVHYNAVDKENPVLTFAEKLKEYAFECDVSFGFGKEHCTKAVAVVDIDRLVEEMTEGENG